MSYKNNVKIGYIRSDNRVYEEPREKYAKFLRHVFSKVQFELIENGTIMVVPEYKVYNKKVIKKVTKQLNSYIKKQGIKYLVFEKELQFLEKNMDIFNILDGKLLMRESIAEILEYIFDIKEQNMNLENIHIFVNEYSKSNISIIENLISKFRTVNIITENLKYFKRLENSLYKDGILITVSNNKKKSAKNAKFIINLDFKKDVFEKYNINMNSIIINLTEEPVFFEKSFKGVQVNNFEVRIGENIKDFVNEFYGNIDKKLYMESILYSGIVDNVETEDLYKKYETHISNLMGVRGVLQKCEFLM